MKVLLVLLALMGTVQAQANSLLGICHKDFNCGSISSLYDGQETIVLSWLENTFGTKCSCLNKLLQDSRPKVIRAHIIQSPCMRNNRCGRYEALYGYTAASASRAIVRGRGRAFTEFQRGLARLKKRLETATNIQTCYVSPCLECDLYESARRRLSSLVLSALPFCNIVDNPFRRKCLSGAICEKHGDTARVSAPCIVDLDGTDGRKVDVKKWVEQYRHCDLQFYWEPWMNCIRGGFIDPRKRDCKYRQDTFDSTRDILCQYFYPLSDTCSL